MIRINKSSVSPDSLAKETSCRGDDVNAQLRIDQHGKCYLCERHLVTDFQVEHLKSRSNYPEMSYVWTNLLWSCSYCYQRKSNSYDVILNPFEKDIECLIFQKVDFPNMIVDIRALNEGDAESETTAKLLDRVFNGKTRLKALRDKPMRTVREQEFYQYTASRIITFQQMVIAWLRERKEELKTAIIEELNIESEFLGFKYWIIQSNPQLLEEFGNSIIWNKKY